MKCNWDGENKREIFRRDEIMEIAILLYVHDVVLWGESDENLDDGWTFR